MPPCPVPRRRLKGSRPEDFQQLGVLFQPGRLSLAAGCAQPCGAMAAGACLLAWAGLTDASKPKPLILRRQRSEHWHPRKEIACRLPQNLCIDESFDTIS